MSEASHIRKCTLVPARVSDVATIVTVCEQTYEGWTQEHSATVKENPQAIVGLLPEGPLFMIQAETSRGVIRPGFVHFTFVRYEVFEVVLAVWPERPSLLRPDLWEAILKVGRKDTYMRRLEFSVPAWRTGLVRFLKERTEHEGTQQEAVYRKDEAKWWNIEQFAVIWREKV